MAAISCQIAKIGESFMLRGVICHGTCSIGGSFGPLTKKSKSACHRVIMKNDFWRQLAKSRHQWWHRKDRWGPSRTWVPCPVSKTHERSTLSLWGRSTDLKYHFALLFHRHTIVGTTQVQNLVVLVLIVDAVQHVCCQISFCDGVAPLESFADIDKILIHKTKKNWVEKNYLQISPSPNMTNGHPCCKSSSCPETDLKNAVGRTMLWIIPFELVMASSSLSFACWNSNSGFWTQNALKRINWPTPAPLAAFRQFKEAW